MERQAGSQTGGQTQRETADESRRAHAPVCARTQHTATRSRARVRAQIEGETERIEGRSGGGKTRR
eukprot:5574051-Pleurochrysis_carterae.AAC.1